MQYILDQEEYDEFIKNREKLRQISSLLKQDYDEDRAMYSFKIKHYRILKAIVHGGACGAGISVNLDGQRFVIYGDYAESIEIMKAIKEL